MSQKIVRASDSLEVTVVSFRNRTQRLPFDVHADKLQPVTGKELY